MAKILQLQSMQARNEAVVREAAKRLQTAGYPVDLLTVAAELEDSGDLERVGYAFLAELYSSDRWPGPQPSW